MENSVSRRSMLKGSLGGLIVASLSPEPVWGQSTLKQRLDWNTFKATPSYSSFLNAIKKMRANTNANDRNSWVYWTKIHVNYCPHGIAYFLAWHRGYLNYFEQQLRLVSGDSRLTVPYWNYYGNPVLPPEFTNPASTNPLYVPRTNSNVAQALSMAPFSNSLTALPRGTANAFEPSVEDMPHNPVHDIIGGVMADMQSPMDPIFWLHHANIDRLWSAWVAAANGRQMPLRTSSYWNGSFTYATNLTLNRRSTFSTRTDLFYYYQNEAMPAALPVVQGTSASVQAEALQSGARNSVEALAQPTQQGNAGKRPKRPPDGRFPVTGMRPSGTNALALAGASQIVLDETSVSARIPLSTAAHDILRQVLGKLTALPFGAAKSVQPYNSVNIVFDVPQVSASGLAGGFFYKVYINLPVDGDGADTEEKYFLGTIGPFRLAGLMHHAQMGHGAAQLSFPATALVQRFSVNELAEMSVSFIRVSGDNSPAGVVISFKECRIEVSTDMPD
ncbi:MAG TPA: tyrosinase family protein [Janthinobacterium sp.]|jgi:tyrosinase|nr:tyrosinase family protein [Janthinobacterium sp.]